MNCAIIDLGTNTCNLIVAEIHTSEKPKAIYRGSLPVRLGKGGINQNIILPDAIERAVDVISCHLSRCEELRVEVVVTIATSAVRSAENAQEVSDAIHAKTGAILNVISGNDEAQLIFEGVSQAVDFSNETQLILDIGGGSNELILAGKTGQLWKQSFNLGVARVIEQFPISDPIQLSEIKAIETYFDENLQPLWKACKQYQPVSLVGCAGAFNTLADVLLHAKPEVNFHERFHVTRDQFDQFYSNIMRSTLDQRNHTDGLAPLRVMMIIPASILIHLIVQKCELVHITATGYALREGAVMRLHQNSQGFNIQRLNY